MSALFTVDDVAARLHKSRRWVQAFLRKRPYGAKLGRTWIFSDEDIDKIRRATTIKFPPPEVIEAAKRLPVPSWFKPKEDPGHVYFIRSGEFIKIGYSKTWQKRLHSLKTANAQAIEILLVIEGSRERERSIHAQFQSSRLRGEWFRPTPDLLTYINTLKP